MVIVYRVSKEFLFNFLNSYEAFSALIFVLLLGKYLLEVADKKISKSLKMEMAYCNPEVTICNDRILIFLSFSNI